MVIWSKIGFSAIIAKKRFFEKKTFSKIFIISRVKHLTSKPIYNLILRGKNVVNHELAQLN